MIVACLVYMYNPFKNYSDLLYLIVPLIVPS